MQALGMIEVYGYLAAIEALDRALKAANVHRLGVSLVTGGLVTVLVTGDVGAVKAAIDAASAATGELCEVVSAHVIPRPDESIYLMVGLSPLISNNLTTKKTACFIKKQENEIKETEPVVEEQNKAIEKELSEADETEQEESVLVEEPIDFSEAILPEKVGAEIDAELETMSLTRLRKLAVDMDIKGMTGKEIRRAKRDILIAAITERRQEE